MNIYLKNILAGLTAITALSGCVDENLEPDGRAEISLSAGVDGLTVSKAPVYPEDQDPLEISLYRWDAGDVSWPDSPALAGQLGHFVSTSTGARREISFDTPQYYTDRTSQVGFIGIYPELGSKNPEGNDNWQPSSDGQYLNGRTLVYNIDGNTDVLVSDFMAGSQETGIDPLPFRHALCMFRFYAYAVDENSQEEWGNLEEVNIVNLPEELIVTTPENTHGSAPGFGYDGYPADPTAVEAMLPLSGFSEELKDGNYALQEGLPSDMDTRYIGTVLGGRPKDGILGLSVRSSHAEDLNSVSIARDFKPGYTYNIVLRFSTSGIINADATVENWEYGGSHNVESSTSFYNDLSRYGTSNCYVVSSANMSYCFDASVKGNGVSEIYNERLNVTIPLLGENPEIDLSQAATVEILRSDAVMKKTESGMEVITSLDERKNKTAIIDPKSVTLRDGKVLFTVKGNQENPEDYTLQTEGNVKIGLKDASGNIIWSWHIWVTDMPLNQNYLNGYVAMDRNLGAVVSTMEEAEAGWTKLGDDLSKNSAEFAYGLYYQFGRKDPMFIPAIYQGPDYASDQMASDISETHSFPMKFYYDGTDASGNWISGVDTDHLWGYISQRDNYVKTMYDPCPPGYRVSGMEIWEQHYTYKSTTGDYGTVMEIGSSGNGKVYYPASHLIYKNEAIKNDNESASGNYTYLLSATPLEGTDRAYHFRFNGSDTSPFIVPETTVENKDEYHTGRATAYPVRCVLESSGKIVTDLSEAQTANSYIIRKTGFYKFKANVRGNGVNKLTVYQTDQNENTVIASMYMNDGLEDALSPARVDLLWWQGGVESDSAFRTFADNAGGLSDEEIEADCPVRILDGGSVDRDGYTTFYVNADKYGSGNVGLAAYDAYDNILWTWHIWIAPDLDNIQVGDYTLMDRNLGSTWAPGGDADIVTGNVVSTFGFYYQWGRKDPFFPPYSYNGNGSKSAPWLYKDSRDGWSVRTAFKENLQGPVSILESVRNPLSFASANQNDWQDSYTDLSGVRNNLWGYTGNAVAPGNAFAKTMYDPCPPGYRVMPHNVVGSARICDSESEQEETVWDGIHVEKYANFITSSGQSDHENNNNTDKNCGYYLNSTDKTKFSGGESVRLESGYGLWLPLSGRLNHENNYSELFESGYLSTATPFNDNSGSRASREIKWTWKNVLTHATSWRFQERYSDRYIITERHTSNWMTDGRPVRCMKE